MYIDKSMIKERNSMNVRECYDAIKGDYEDVKARLLSDARIRRFALMFLRDSSMDELRTAMSETNYEKAFQAAHTLKGVCLNLGLKGLYEPTAKITEMLRNSKYDEAEQMMEELEAEYKCHCDNLSALEEA